MWSVMWNVIDMYVLGEETKPHNMQLKHYLALNVVLVCVCVCVREVA